MLVSSPTALLAALLLATSPPPAAAHVPAATPAARVSMARLRDIVVTTSPKGTVVEVIVEGGAAAARDSVSGLNDLTVIFTGLASDFPQQWVSVGRGQIRQMALLRHPDGIALSLALNGKRDYIVSGTDSSFVLTFREPATAQPSWRLRSALTPTMAVAPSGQAAPAGTAPAAVSLPVNGPSAAVSADEVKRIAQRIRARQDSIRLAASGQVASARPAPERVSVMPPSRPVMGDSAARAAFLQDSLTRVANVRAVQQQAGRQITDLAERARQDSTALLKRQTEDAREAIAARLKATRDSMSRVVAWTKQRADEAEREQQAAVARATREAAERMQQRVAQMQRDSAALRDAVKNQEEMRRRVENENRHAAELLARHIADSTSKANSKAEVERQARLRLAEETNRRLMDSIRSTRVRDSLKVAESAKLAVREADALHATRDSLLEAGRRHDDARNRASRMATDSAIRVLAMRTDSLVKARVTEFSERLAAQDSIAKSARFSADQRPITVTFKNRPINSVLGAFAEVSGTSIIPGKGIDAQMVTAEIKDQPWPVALEAILSAQGMIAHKLPSGIIQVDAASALVENEKVEAVETRIFRLNYGAADSLRTVITSMKSKRGDVVADKASNSIIATDVPSSLERMQDMIKDIDKPTKQVLIQARLVFIQQTNMNAMGFTYDLKDSRGPAGFTDVVPFPASSSGTTPTGVTLTRSTVGGVGLAGYSVAKPTVKILATLAGANSPFALTSFLEALTQLDLAHTEAAPSVAAMDNQMAQILVGQEIPVRTVEAGAAGASSAGGALTSPLATVSFKEVGIKLNVKPHVTNDGHVVMEVEAENSSAQIAGSDIGLVISKQHVQNKVQVASGETMVLGGLTVKSFTSSTSGIPILSSLPIIGKLFQNTTKQENKQDLIILITPRLIDSAPIIPTAPVPALPKH